MRILTLLIAAKLISALPWSENTEKEYIPRPSHVHTIPLGSEAAFHWSVDFENELIRIEIHYFGDEASWFAVGFSDYGSFTSADYCVFWKKWDGQTNLEDASTDANGTVRSDVQQDCKDFQWVRRKNLTKFTYSRAFDTCDDEDYAIEGGTTHIVWLKGPWRLDSLKGLKISDATAKWMTRAQLRRVFHPSPPMPESPLQLQLRANQVRVPNKETTYWCHVHKLPPELKEKHHVLKFEPVIQEGNEYLVHHMEVFHCSVAANKEIPSYNGPCDSPDRPEETQVCRKVLAAWAMGADAFVYPAETGLPMGGDKFNRYVMLEIHYNNPELKSGQIDSSGIQFLLTKELRKYDAGVIELGLEYSDKMAIPPGQEAFTLTGYCITKCTGMGLPRGGIKIFASQLHTHLLGTKVITRHARNGEELPILNRDDHYSTHFQEIRLLPEPVLVLPGDSLTTTCAYNSMERSNVTLGGFAISDEMCVNYVHYYPSTKLEVCKSAISLDALNAYFEWLRKWEEQPTLDTKTISDNYRSIEWTKLRSAGLHERYTHDYIGMQCTGSDGSRLPGSWDSVNSTLISKPLPEPTRDCPGIGDH